MVYSNNSEKKMNYFSTGLFYADPVLRRAEKPI